MTDPVQIPLDAAGRVKTAPSYRRPARAPGEPAASAAASALRNARTIRFPENEDAVLIRLAFNLGLSINDTVRRAVRELAERDGRPPTA